MWISLHICQTYMFNQLACLECSDCTCSLCGVASKDIAKPLRNQVCQPIMLDNSQFENMNTCLRPTKTTTTTMTTTLMTTIATTTTTTPNSSRKQEQQRWQSNTSCATNCVENSRRANQTNPQLQNTHIVPLGPSPKTARVVSLIPPQKNGKRAWYDMRPGLTDAPDPCSEDFLCLFSSCPFFSCNFIAYHINIYM